MSAAASGSEHVDIDGLLGDLKVRASEVEDFADSLKKGPKLHVGSSEQLIDDVASSLATMREASGLPTKDAAHFKARIKQRQREA